ncbi:Hsp20/alpha crystallin family protein [Pararhizobium mangrovi]|uniref:Hsp20/alpha crystallin family protein n=2 Tax=Pararhizobium mangrovi TaxID=2590452 RepID=A0A506U2Z5_9HYPH|nr:Hsp20/alpha crystallin family protein [Pararhizobium mangrovi]
MWAEALGMLARADRAQRQLYQPGDGPAQQAAWEPPVDILDTGGDVLIVAALPGVAREDVKVTLDGADVVLTGARVPPAALRTADIHRMELPQGRFHRRVPLPPGRYDQVSLEMQAGCLYVALRKTP